MRTNADTHGALYGHLEILQYVHEHGCPWDETTYKNAKSNSSRRKACLSYLMQIYAQGSQGKIRKPCVH